MAKIIEFLKQAFVPGQAKEPLPAGVYHYIAPPEDPFNHRLHLRLEADGTGLLIINAATVLHLNQTAAEFAWHIVNQSTKEEAARAIQQRYRVSFSNALRGLSSSARTDQHPR